jgi:hypothetical protein
VFKNVVTQFIRLRFVRARPEYQSIERDEERLGSKVPARPTDKAEHYLTLFLTSLLHSVSVSNNVTMADEEEDIDVDDLICAPGAHKWKNHECMICTLCGECTGYGNSCVNSGMPARNPGQ